MSYYHERSFKVVPAVNKPVIDVVFFASIVCWDKWKGVVHDTLAFKDLWQKVDL